MSVDPRYAARFQREFDPSEHGAGDAAGAAGATPDRRDPDSQQGAEANAVPTANPFTREGAAQLGSSASPYARSAVAAAPGPISAPAPTPPAVASDSPYARSAAAIADPTPMPVRPAHPISESSPSSPDPDPYVSRGSRATVPVQLGPNGERLAPAAAQRDADPAARYAEVADELSDDELRELGLLPRPRVNPWVIVLAVISVLSLVVAVALSMQSYEMQADGYGAGFDSDRGAADQAWFFFLQQAGQSLASPLYFLGILGTVLTIVLLLVLRRRR